MRYSRRVDHIEYDISRRRFLHLRGQRRVDHLRGHECADRVLTICGWHQDWYRHNLHQQRIRRCTEASRNFAANGARNQR